jgi:pilus assembly protein CpaB
MSEPSKSLRDIVSFQTSKSGAGSAAAGNKMLSGGFAGRLRMKLVVGVAFAIVCAGGAAYLADVWFQNQMNRLNNTAQTEPGAPQLVQMPTRTVVVAASDLAYGTEITAGTVREIQWPQDSIPEGTFQTIAEVVSAETRVALVPLSRNEVVLQSRVSAPGQRASLSAMLAPGMKAVAIRVDDVLGVAGLIQPGDRVDVLWIRSGSGSRGDESYSELLVRGVAVLAIDQRIDEGNEESSGKADVARAVTVEVDVIEAQRIALAADSGKLVLALRHLGAEVEESSRRVTITELGVRPNAGHASDAPATIASGDADGAHMIAATSPDVPARRRPFDDRVVIGVRRGLERSEYNVMTTQR